MVVALVVAADQGRQVRPPCGFLSHREGRVRPRCWGPHPRLMLCNPGGERPLGVGFSYQPTLEVLYCAGLSCHVMPCHAHAHVHAPCTVRGLAEPSLCRRQVDQMS